MKFERFKFTDHSQIGEMVGNYLMTISNVKVLSELSLAEINEFLNEQEDWFFHDEAKL